MYLTPLNGHLLAEFTGTPCIVPLERVQRTVTDLKKERVNSEDGLFFSGARDRLARLLRELYNYYDARTTEFSLSLALARSLYLCTANYHSCTTIDSTISPRQTLTSRVIRRKWKLALLACIKAFRCNYRDHPSSTNHQQ